MAKSGVDSFRITTIKIMAVEIYKILNDMGPDYLSYVFSISNTPYQLRDDNKLIQPLKRTITFGIKYFAYFGTHLWNMLPNHIKNSVSLYDFKLLMRKWSGPTCCCSVCTLVQFSIATSFCNILTWYNTFYSIFDVVLCCYCIYVVYSVHNNHNGRWLALILNKS